MKGAYIMHEFNWQGFFEAYQQYEMNVRKNLPTKNCSVEKAFNTYLLKVEAELSEGTYSFNKCHLKVIRDYLENKFIFTLGEITQGVVEEFKAYSYKKGNKNVTINKHVELLHRVMRYCKKIDLYDGDIFEYNKLKEKQVEVKYIELDDLQRISDYINLLKLQNQVIVLLIMETGIRRRECSLIEVKNINFDNNSIYLVNTKSGKSRYCYFSNELKILIQKLSETNKEYLFVNDIGNDHISVNAISCVFKRIGRKLDIENLSTHKLRHSYATYLLKNNVNIMEVKQLMGHSSVSTTMRYLHNDDEVVKTKSINCNPLALIKQKKDTRK